MCGKSNMETYITICKIHSQQEFAVWLRKLKQGLCINLEGDGKEVQKGEDIFIPMAIHIEVDRNQQNSVKQLSFNKKIKRKKKISNNLFILFGVFWVVFLKFIYFLIEG